jgi:fructokinase
MTGHKYFGAVEGGGTKFVCMVASGPDDILEEVRFATTTPDETLEQVIAFFEPFVHQGKLAAVGLASFGPVDLQPDSPIFGSITTTPKPGWGHTDMIGKIRSAFNIPIAFEMDVNAAVFGEYFWAPENRQRDPLVYFTIGTGIGAGIIVNGQIVHGLIHPEAGHMRLPHDWQADPYAGHCPYHGDCFEGLACGPAMSARWHQPADTLPPEHDAWELEANYIAQAMTNAICMLSPRRIILGGGVMQQPHLLPRVRQKVLGLLNNYIQSPGILEHIDETIVSPALGNRSGVLGAIALARNILL